MLKRNQSKEKNETPQNDSFYREKKMLLTFSHSTSSTSTPQRNNASTPPSEKKSRGKIKGGISEKIVSFIRQRYTDPIKTNYISGKNTLAKVFRHFIFIDVDAYRVGCKFLSSFRYKFICIVVLH